MTEHEHAEAPAWQYTEVSTVGDVMDLMLAGRVSFAATLTTYYGDYAVTWYGWSDGCEMNPRTGRAEKRNEANGA